jgi:hypothetical protein
MPFLSIPLKIELPLELGLKSPRTEKQTIVAVRANIDDSLQWRAEGDE